MELALEQQPLKAIVKNVINDLLIIRLSTIQTRFSYIYIENRVLSLLLWFIALVLNLIHFRNFRKIPLHPVRQASFVLPTHQGQRI